jgi:hypothetical protein
MNAYAQGMQVYAIKDGLCIAVFAVKPGNLQQVVAATISGGKTGMQACTQ